MLRECEKPGFAIGKENPGYRRDARGQTLVS